MSEMAIVTFTVTVAGGVVTISPDPTQVTLLKGDFAVFKNAAGGNNKVHVEMVSGNAEVDGRIIMAVKGDSSRVVLHNPVLEPDGTVTITFGQGGGGGPEPGFPP